MTVVCVLVLVTSIASLVVEISLIVLVEDADLSSVVVEGLPFLLMVGGCVSFVLVEVGVLLNVLIVEEKVIGRSVLFDPVLRNMNIEAAVFDKHIGLPSYIAV